MPFIFRSSIEIALYLLINWIDCLCKKLNFEFLILLFLVNYLLCNASIGFSREALLIGTSLKIKLIKSRDSYR